MFLIEKKFSIQEMKPIQTALKFPFMKVVSSLRRSGRLALLWKDDIVLNIQIVSSNHIDSFVYNLVQGT